ncbi:MAG TPA: ABC transporter permease [Steroidobacteraceae bacterium]|nr:ABC transporter permease [Steroidobacteraceae bacterium]
MRWIAFTTLFRRECAVIARYWLVTLAPPAISMALYFGIFGKVLGGRIGTIVGVPYIEYMAPGLIALTAIPSAFMHSAAGMLGARFIGYIEEVLVAPQPRWIVLAGYVAGGVMRGLVVASMAALVALLFSGFHGVSPGLTLVAVLLAATISATGGFITGMLAKSFERVSMTQGLILVPMAFLGGVFVPVSALPEWARFVSHANPVFYMVSAVRSGIGGAAEAPVALSIAVMLVFAAALLLIALRLVSTRELRQHGG